MTVYIDQYIITNLLMNYVILRITKAIIKSKKNNSNLIFSAVAGTLFSTLILFPKLYFLNNNICKISIPLIMVITAYGVKHFIKNIIVFYFISFLTGGCGFAVKNILYEYGLGDTAYVLLLSVAFSYISLKNIVAIYEKYFKYDRLTHALTIKLFEKEITTECFYDTGNNLTDPVSKLPVIVVSYEISKNILPQKLNEIFQSEKDVLKIYSTNNSRLKLKLIPFYTISDNGFIIGFIPDEILIDNKKINAIVGIAPSSFESQKKYKAIANPQINWTEVFMKLWTTFFLNRYLNC